VKKKHYRFKGEKSPAQTRETFEVTIEKIVPGGYGLAHAEGKTIFVSLAAKGDRAIVRVEKKKGAACFASIVELIEPSPLRTEPRCRYFGRCGGCDFQQMNYEAQLESKREIILDCLRRIGKLEPPNGIKVNPSSNEWNYRSRAQWRYDSQRNFLGYYERNSHNVCDVVDCPVLTPALQKSLKSLRSLKQSNELPFDVEEFDAVANDATSLMPEPDFSPTKNINIKIGEFDYTFSAEVFFQTNYELLPALIDFAIGDAKGETALDLYCGVGLFTLPLAKRFRRVVGVESFPQSVLFARQSAVQMDNISFHCLSVSDWLKENVEKFDFVLLDPPRAGAESETIESVIRLRPKRISYVSCDPATLARDLRMLTDGGFVLEQIAGFDLFPQTHHVETVAKLSLVSV
jgi:23S rRNA (uracil1939-C5)-methyltransferase